MQSDDLRRTLAAAAAEPSRPLDAHAVLAKGARLRRARAVAAATGLTIVLGGASAALGSFWPNRSGDPGPGPAGTTTAEVCDPSFGSSLAVVIFVKDDAPPLQVQALRTDLEQSPDVAQLQYVSAEEAHREVSLGLKGMGDAHPPSLRSMQGSFRITAVSATAVRRLSLHAAPAVDDVRTGQDVRRYLCARGELRHEVVPPFGRPIEGPNFDYDNPRGPTRRDGR